MKNQAILAILLLCLVIGISTKYLPENFEDSETVEIDETDETDDDENNKAKGKIWALLVAGSNGYSNYRHQSDVCHSYQILKENGIKDENIVVMMYDDIAEDPENPTPGIIINEPNGTNVYEGVPKDYTGDDLTPRNFLNILAGNKKKMRGIGSGKVIKSKSNDKIFVFYSDHGSPGVLGMIDEELHASDLHDTLTTMSSNNKFSKLVFFVEACHAGSMFDNILPDTIDIIVTTASDPYESSYACYYDDERDTFLGDEFSVNWMYHVKENDTAKGAIHHTFQKVRSNTTDSHVEEYGDLNIGSTPIKEFIGQSKHRKMPVSRVDPTKDAVNSYDVPMFILHKKAQKANSNEEKSMYQSQIKEALQRREIVHDVIDKIVAEITTDDEEKIKSLTSASKAVNKNNMYCTKNVINAFSNNCFKLGKNLYVRSMMEIFIKSCNVDWLNEEDVVRAITNTCSGMEKHVGII